jgi:hypothetical protein
MVFLRDMVSLRNICVNTLHKGDSIFTINNNNNNNNNNCNPHKVIFELLNQGE